MLFNSYAFLLAYLPLTLLGYFALGRLGKTWGAAWLAACSLFFYGWWDHRYLTLLLASIVVNYHAGAYIARNAGTPQARRALTLAVVANLALLGYYKYADFFIGSANTLLGTDWSLLHIVLPIGISFFTFTQIAFLVDAYAGKVTEYRFVYYLLFVTYFPHLIAGPVLHHKEMMPQFDDDRNYRPQAADFALGVTMFVIGLTKKVLIADSLAPHVGPVFDPGGAMPSLFQAWGGALAYTFQLYFDFSGYSDMAIGLSLMFGVRLPLNFDSPYKSSNIVEFWRRWHMTLSRFLRDYLYIPLGGNRHGPFRRHLYLMITMLLGGLWHGAGWSFVVWGALHGGFLVVNHAWQDLSRRLDVRLPRAVAVALTFLCVVFAWVYFRAPDLTTANRVVLGMLGAGGAELPAALIGALGGVGTWLTTIGVEPQLGGGASFVQVWAWIGSAMLIAFLAPNSQQIMRLTGRPEPGDTGSDAVEPLPRWVWRPSRVWAVATGLLFAIGILALGRPTEFLYFQF